MTVSDEQLLHLLTRTSALVARRQRDAEHQRPPAEPYGMQAGGPGPRDFGPPPAGRPDAPPPEHRRDSPHHAQNRVLATLNMQEGLSQKELAYVLGIRPQSLSETLVQLQQAGLIVRKKNKDDGRVINVYLTDAGRERAKAAAASRRKSAQGAFSTLSDKEKQQLAHILSKLADSLE